MKRNQVDNQSELLSGILWLPALQQVPSEGATTVRRYSDVDVVFAINSQIDETVRQIRKYFDDQGNDMATPDRTATTPPLKSAPVNPSTKVEPEEQK